MAICQKIISANGQPSGGNGVVSIAGARGLRAGTFIADIASKNIVSPFPPFLDTQLDQSIAVINNKLDTRFDDIAYYGGVDGGAP
jgi:hypothetical protein